MQVHKTIDRMTRMLEAHAAREQVPWRSESVAGGSGDEMG